MKPLAFGMTLILGVGVALSESPVAHAGGGGCTGNGCANKGLCNIPNEGVVAFESHLDSYSDMGDVVIVSPTIRESTWTRVSAEGIMGDFGDVTVTLDTSQGPSVYRMISQSPTGTPFFPAEVEVEFYWKFEIQENPLGNGPLTLLSNKVVYRAGNVESFPPPPGTAFTLASAMTLTSPNNPEITCTVQLGCGQVIYSGQGTVPAVLVNEVDLEDGGGNRQFLELYDGGAGLTSLNDVTVVLFSGDDEKPYEILRLTGRTTNRAGFFVIGDPEVPNVDLPKTTRWRLNSGAIGLYVTPGATFVPEKITSTNHLMDAVVFGSSEKSHRGLGVLIRPGMPQPDERRSRDRMSQSLQRVPDGGSRRDTRRFRAQPPTPGSPNQSHAPQGAQTGKPLGL